MAAVDWGLPVCPARLGAEVVRVRRLGWGLREVVWVRPVPPRVWDRPEADGVPVDAAVLVPRGRLQALVLQGVVWGCPARLQA